MAVSSVKFWDKQAPSYIKSKIGDEAAYEEGLRRIREVVGPNDNVLEIGCGTGMSALKLASAVGHIHATDISPEMIALAKRRNPPANVSFDVLELRGAWAQPNVSDAVIALNLLHLVPDVEGVLREIYRQTKPGGVFVSKTACLKGWKWFIPPLIRVAQAIGKAPDVNMFTVEEFDAMIEAAGFEINEVAILPNNPPRRFVIARKPRS